MVLCQLGDPVKCPIPHSQALEFSNFPMSQERRLVERAFEATGTRGVLCPTEFRIFCNKAAPHGNYSQG